MISPVPNYGSEVWAASHIKKQNGINLFDMGHNLCPFYMLSIFLAYMWRRANQLSWVNYSNHIYWVLICSTERLSLTFEILVKCNIERMTVVKRVRCMGCPHITIHTFPIHPSLPLQNIRMSVKCNDITQQNVSSQKAIPTIDLCHDCHTNAACF